MSEMFYAIGESKCPIQIIMFPYLGGSGTSVMSLANEICAKIPVDIRVAFPPGHVESDYALCDNFVQLIDLYYKNLITILKKDSILFGHSMGGTIAYFLAKKIAEKNPELTPKKLIFSAAAAPDHMKNKRLSDKENEIIFKEIKRIGTMPEELTDNQELVDYFAPMLRADYKILEEISEIEVQKIDIPTFFIMCHKDSLTSCQTILKWKDYLDSKISFYMMPADAGHMYLKKYKEVVADKIVSFLDLNSEEENDQ
ncbi:thioesterase II family protein [Streptococcus mutans]|uniref:thioesterase II family protein n=1 Tax=Streptococcus mutans TaxID=1309 RepID=UPI0027420862|nr:thioesterase domain-containing protein [Streptococcus mutans]MDP5865587.1 thioesterase domain-containing protein [Streptococcus mutans]